MPSKSDRAPSQIRTFERKDQISYYGSFVLLFWLGTAGIILITAPFFVIPKNKDGKNLRAASQILVSIYTIFTAVLYLWMIIRRRKYQEEGWIYPQRLHTLTTSQASLMTALYLLGLGTILRILINCVDNIIILCSSNPAEINTHLDVGNIVLLIVRMIAVVLQLWFFYIYNAKVIINHRCFHKTLAFLVAAEVWSWLYQTTDPIWHNLHADMEDIKDPGDFSTAVTFFFLDDHAKCREKFWLTKVGHFLNPLSVEYSTIAVITLLELWLTAISLPEKNDEENTLKTQPGDSLAASSSTVTEVTESCATYSQKESTTSARPAADTSNGLSLDMTIDEIKGDEEEFDIKSDPPTTSESSNLLEDKDNHRDELSQFRDYFRCRCKILDIKTVHCLLALTLSLLYFVPRLTDIGIPHGNFRTIFTCTTLMLCAAPTTVLYVIIINGMKNVCPSTLSDLSLKANDYLLLITGSCGFALSMLQVLCGFFLLVLTARVDVPHCYGNMTAITDSKHEMYLHGINALHPAVVYWVWTALQMKFMILMQRHTPMQGSSYKLLENCLIHVIIVNAFQWFSLGMIVEGEHEFNGASAMECIIGPEYQVFVLLLTPTKALFRFHSVVTAYEMWKYISVNKPKDCRLAVRDKSNESNSENQGASNRTIFDDNAQYWINDRVTSGDSDVTSDTESTKAHHRQRVERVTYPFGKRV